MVYELQEINYIVWQDILKIQEYLKKSNLKHDPKEYTYTSHNIKRIVTFQKLDYFICIKEEINISNPFAYFFFTAKTEDLNNYTHNKSYKAFDWVFMNEKPGKSLNKNAELVINDQKQMIIIAYMRKEFIK